MSLKIRRLDAEDGIGSTEWTPIVSPCDCNNMAISNREAVDGLWICTEPLDPKTRLYVPPGAEQGFSAPMHWAPHFPANKPAVYVKTVAGTGPIVVYWL